MLKWLVNKLRIKSLVDEDFVNYKLPTMFVAIGRCNWKCCVEANIPIETCQNSELAKQEDIEMPVEKIFHRYISNPISKAVVVGGLEPFTQYSDIFELIKHFRDNDCEDEFIIYTGYKPDEIPTMIDQLKGFKNIIIKYGRYKPNQQPHLDTVLGVNLVSDNQYAERIS